MDKTNYSIKKMFTYSSSKPKILSFLGIVLICIMVNKLIYMYNVCINF